MPKLDSFSTFSLLIVVVKLMLGSKVEWSSFCWRVGLWYGFFSSLQGWFCVWFCVSYNVLKIAWCRAAKPWMFKCLQGVVWGNV
jgi:hypothetical protein